MDTKFVVILAVELILIGSAICFLMSVVYSEQYPLEITVTDKFTIGNLNYIADQNSNLYCVYDIDTYYAAKIGTTYFADIEHHPYANIFINDFMKDKITQLIKKQLY